MTTQSARIEELEKALRKVNVYLDGIALVNKRLREGYEKMHPGIPHYCKSFDRCCRESVAVIEAALKGQQ